jgi:hypothetical protein
VGEQLKATADVIDTIQQKLPYQGKLGRGRVNLFRALTETNHPSVVLVSDQVSDGGDMAFTVGDTLNISGVFVNYLNLAPSVEVHCSSNSPFVQMIDSLSVLGDIAAMDSASNSLNPFRALVLQGAPVNHRVEFTLKITTTSGYTWLEYISLVVNVDYLNIQVNEVATTITSRGNVGFNSISSAQGLGFIYNSQNLLYEAGLMISQSSAAVSDRVRGASGTVDADLLSVVNIHPLVPSNVSDFDCEGVFNDSGAVNPIPVRVVQRAYAWDTPGNEKYVRFEYDIINVGTSALNGMYAGMFADWDIMNASMNRAETDLPNRLGYCYSTQAQGLYGAIQLLSPQNLNVYSIDLVSGGAGGINLADGFDSQEKFTGLSGQRIAAGTGGSGNDVAHVVAGGPFNIPPADTVTLAFAFHGGDNLNQIQTSAQNALQQYLGSPVGSAIDHLKNSVSVFPNPADEFINIQGISSSEIEVFSSSGMKMQTEFLMNKDVLSLQTADFPAGIYFLRIQRAGSVSTLKFAVHHN